MIRYLLLSVILLTQHHAPTSDAMGFDQSAVAHHFLLKRDGGAIDVAVRRASDRATLAAVRMHLQHAAGEFARGNFEAPVVTHGEAPTGVVTLQRLSSSIHYAYTQTRRGGRIDITTANGEAVAALHEFLRYQIAEHRTGDSTTAK